MLDRERHLELRAVNLFAGPNGSGKTTFLDAVRSLFDPTMLARLRRENIPSGVVSGLHATFDSGSQVIALFHQTGKQLDSRSGSEWAWQYTEIGVRVVDVAGVGHNEVRSTNLPLLGPLNEDYVRPIRQSLAKLGRVGRAWPAEASKPSLEEYSRILRGFRRFFPHNEPRRMEHGPEFASKPGDVWPSNDALHQYHADDLAQSSALPLEYLPSGWQQLVELLSWVERCEDHSICVIDEPERHLHPTLQRALLTQLASLRQSKNLQLVIATHSPTFLNRRAWGDFDDVALFHLSRGRAVAEPRLEGVLEQLGCLASDLCQANGLIWVEGPSDRIYLKAFLRAWASRQRPGEPAWVENLDYAFACFDGSCLSHYAGVEASDPQDFIRLLSLNRNVALMMDRDDDFGIDDFGEQFPVTAHGRTKLRVSAELAASGHTLVHLTADYTIECYVTAAMPMSFVDVTGGKVRVVGSKVQHATRFALLDDAKILTCIEGHPTLARFVGRLDEAIARWNGAVES